MMLQVECPQSGDTYTVDMISASLQVMLLRLTFVLASSQVYMIHMVQVIDMIANLCACAPQWPRLGTVHKLRNQIECS